MEISFAIYPSLNGKNILITGGASGIGKELVKGFAEQGSNVGFLDLNVEAGEQLSSDVGKNVFFQLFAPPRTCEFIASKIALF